MKTEKTLDDFDLDAEMLTLEEAENMRTRYDLAAIPYKHLDPLNFCFTHYRLVHDDILKARVDAKLKAREEKFRSEPFQGRYSALLGTHIGIVEEVLREMTPAEKLSLRERVTGVRQILKR